MDVPARHLTDSTPASPRSRFIAIPCQPMQGPVAPRLPFACPKGLDAHRFLVVLSES